MKKVSVKLIGKEKLIRKKMVKKVIKTYKLTDLTIGSKVFLVHKDYAYQKKVGGRVVVGRVVIFVNRNGTVIPEFKITGSNLFVNENSHVIFTDIKKAIQAIKS